MEVQINVLDILTDSPELKSADIPDLVEISMRTFETVADGFPEELRTTLPVCGYWNLKQLIDHLNGWNTMTINEIENPGTTDWVEPGKEDDFNAKSVEERENKSFEESLDEFKHLNDRILSMYPDFKPEDWEMPQEQEGNFFTLREQAIATANHYREHLYQVYTALQELESSN